MRSPKEELRLKVEAALASLDMGGEPEGLYAPVSYTLSLGGKRLRPVLALMACGIYGGDIDAAMPLACALEIYHNHTLVHDDVMDNAALRRGNPTVHAKWGSNAAILSGDAMLLIAYKVLMSMPERLSAGLVQEFTDMAIKICEGQQLDMDFEKRNQVSEEEYIEMIRLKTAVFFATALKCGGAAAGAPQSDAKALYDLGINFGLAFQLQDDLLDVYGDAAVFGKNTGGDIVCNKKTFLLIHALNNASRSDYEQLTAWMQREKFDEQEKVAVFKQIYQTTGAKAAAEEKIASCFARVEDGLSSLSLPAESTEPLRELLLSLVHRTV